MSSSHERLVHVLLRSARRTKALLYVYLGVSKIGNPQNGWFIMVPNPIKIDDLGVFAYFWKHPFGFIMLLFHGMEFGFSFRFSSLNT